jgi:beta-phosphoglucomutase-like phosphatase (HAD superfamily)
MPLPDNLNIKAVLWDVDGTLINSEPLQRACVDEILGRHNIQLTLEDRKKMVGRSIEINHAYIVEKFGYPVSLDDYVAAAVNYLVTHADKAIPIEDSVDIIPKLTDINIKQAAVTNSQRGMLDAFLSCLSKDIDLGRHFDFDISRSEVERGKPAPDSYLAAADALNIDPDHCLVVEDSPTGIQAGLKAGMAVIARTLESDIADNLSHAHLVVDDLRDIDWTTIT